MPDSGRPGAAERHATAAALIVLLVVTAVMLLALLSRTAPNPPLEVAPFALAPFLGTSLALGAAALYLVAGDARAGSALALVFGATALVSFGPQKYFDPAFSRIWPAVIAAQIAIAVLVASSSAALFRKRARS